MQRTMNWRWTCPASPATSTCLMTPTLIRRRKWSPERTTTLRLTACLSRASLDHSQPLPRRTSSPLPKRRRRNRRQRMTVPANTREAKTVTIKRTRNKMILLCRLPRRKSRPNQLKRPRHSLLRRLRSRRPSIMTMQMTTTLSVDSVGTV